MSVVAKDPLRAAAAVLAAAGVPSPRVDAELLAAQVLGVVRAALPSASWPAGAVEEYDRLVSLRASRVPVQYLTGVAGFRRLELAVGPGVFIPRPETECLTGWAVGLLSGMPSPVVVDLCAGSGAVALAIADEVPAAQVHAVESDPAAFGWLSRNCAGSRVVASHADLADGAPGLAGVVDLVTANPPYLPSGIAAEVEPEVRDHEPAAALWVAGDGLAVIRRVVERAAVLLRPGGWLAVEHSDEQQPAVLALLAVGGWADCTGHADLAGRPRFVTARWPR